MGGFEQQLKNRAKELKSFFKKGMKFVEESCKKGWHKIRNIKPSAQKQTKKSTKEILEVRKRSINNLVTLDVHNYETKEAIHLLKLYLRSPAGIPSVLEVIVETKSEDMAKGAEN